MANDNSWSPPGFDPSLPADFQGMNDPGLDAETLCPGDTCDGCRDCMPEQFDDEDDDYDNQDI
jgi:hypothetical protein